MIPGPDILGVILGNNIALYAMRAFWVVVLRTFSEQSAWDVTKHVGGEIFACSEDYGHVTSFEDALPSA